MNEDVRENHTFRNIMLMSLMGASVYGGVQYVKSNKNNETKTTSNNERLKDYKLYGSYEDSKHKTNVFLKGDSEKFDKAMFSDTKEDIKYVKDNSMVQMIGKEGRIKGKEIYTDVDTVVNAIKNKTPKKLSRTLPKGINAVVKAL